MSTIRSHSGEVGRRRDRLFHAGIVKSEVQALEGLGPVVQSSLDVLRARHVAPDGERPRAECLDHSGGFLIALFRNVGDNDIGALASECQRGSAADATRCPGHEGDLARKTPILIGHHPLLSAFARV